MKKRYLVILLIILVVIAVLISVWAVFIKQDMSQTNTDIQNQDSDLIEKNEDTISIPGYEGITLRADSLEQTVSLDNPIQNTCYFVITLYLEDGTRLWQSDYIKPGETSSPIVLNQPLEKGTYPNAVLQYSCFKMDSEKTPLNGAETKLTLRVK